VTQHHIPEDMHPQQYPCANFKAHATLFVMPDASHLNSERMLRGFLLKATRVMQQIMTLSSHMMKIWPEGTSTKVLSIRFVSSDLRKCPPGSEKD